MIQRYGYKVTVLVGLVTFGIGAAMFYPAAELLQYGWFLTALFVIAAGLSFLETSANPLITVLGDPARAEQRLNLAQAFNPLGAITGVVIGREFILSGVEPTKAELAAMSQAQLAAFQTAEAQSVQTPYLIVAAVVLCLGGAGCDHEVSAPGASAEARRSRSTLDASVDRRVADARAFHIRRRRSVLLRGRPGGRVEFHDSLCAGRGAGHGRENGSELSDRVAGVLHDRTFRRHGADEPLQSDAAHGNLCDDQHWSDARRRVRRRSAGLYALAATSLFMSIMFPTIFANSLRDLGPLTKTASSFLVMAIIGGAVLTAVMGVVSDASAINYAILVPTVCFVVIGWFAWSAGRQPVAVLQPIPAAVH